MPVQPTETSTTKGPRQQPTVDLATYQGRRYQIPPGSFTCNRQGVDETTEKGLEVNESTKSRDLQRCLDKIEMESDFHPPLEREEHNQLFTFVERVDPKEGTFYADLTGNFPVRSLYCMVTVFLL